MWSHTLSNAGDRASLQRILKTAIERWEVQHRAIKGKVCYFGICDWAFCGFKSTLLNRTMDVFGAVNGTTTLRHSVEIVQNITGSLTVTQTMKINIYL